MSKCAMFAAAAIAMAVFGIAYGAGSDAGSWIGVLSCGAVSIGYYAHTVMDGYALGKHVFIHKM